MDTHALRSSPVTAPHTCLSQKPANSSSRSRDRTDGLLPSLGGDRSRPVSLLCVPTILKLAWPTAAPLTCKALWGTLEPTVTAYLPQSSYSFIISPHLSSVSESLCVFLSYTHAPAFPLGAHDYGWPEQVNEELLWSQGSGELRLRLQ